MPILIGLFVIAMMVVLLYSLYQGFAANDPGSKTGMAIWLFVPMLTAWSIGANFGENYGEAAVPSAIVLMLAYCCYRPQDSNLKSMMLSGIKVPASIVAAICLTVPAIRLVYALLSGELKNEGFAGLPVEWMLSLVYPGLVGLGLVILVAAVKKFGIVQFEIEERRQFQERFDQRSRDRNGDGRGADNGNQGQPGDGHDPDDPTPFSDGDSSWPEILGVPRSANREEIRSAANQLRKTYHPDKMAHMPRFREEAERQIKIINRAVD